MDLLAIAAAAWLSTSWNNSEENRRAEFALVASNSPSAKTIETADAGQYPNECCPNYCSTMAEVSRIVEDGNGAFIETRSYGRLTVPPSLERRESPDSYFHICAGFTDHAVQVKCIFVPPMM